MSAIKFGGRTAEEAVAAQQQKEFAQQKERGAIKDPVPSASGTDAELLSQFNDFTGWTEQFLNEMAALARKQKRLQIKLKDPALEQSPQRPMAMVRYQDMHSDLIQYMNDIAMLEARTDRIWQALKPDVKERYGMDWGVTVDEARLIGKAWTVKAKSRKWPVEFSVSVSGFTRVPPYVRMELEKYMGTETVMLGKEFQW